MTVLCIHDDVMYCKNNGWLINCVPFSIVFSIFNSFFNVTIVSFSKAVRQRVSNKTCIIYPRGQGTEFRKSGTAKRFWLPA